MKKLSIVIAATAVLLSPLSNAQTLDELARIVREAASSETKINEQREAEFVRDRNRQRDLLAAARQELAGENARSDRLRDEYDVNERSLAELETTLAERMGNLGELFGVVRQASGDIQAALDDSMVTAQYPGRTKFLADLSSRRELPTVPELRNLWSAMVTEIAESGKVVKFTAPVERTSGEKQEMEIVRVGVFNAVADGQFLDWDTSKSRENLIELARQPADRFRGMADDLEGAAPGGSNDMAVDFTRGQILRAVVQSKTPWERVEEDGGVVGWVIIGVGLFGLLMCSWKAFSLYTTGGRISRQMKSETADKKSPLADEFGVPFRVIGDDKGAADDDAMVNCLDEFDVDYVILARYMRILPAQTCWQFAGGRIVNLHHGLLPGFPGFRPYHDAFNARMLTFGATCHFIIPELDAGNQTINQRTFSVVPARRSRG